MSDKIRNAILQISALLLALLIIGLSVEYFVEDSSIHWPVYIAMMFFFAVIFGIGMYAGTVRKSDNTDDVILASRAVPLGVAVFTMSATWLGGGYINGAAESASKSGLLWVQAPWGYALSLIFGGLFFAEKMRRHEFTTLLDPFERRYNKSVAAWLYLPALTGEVFWTAAILTALGTTFGTMMNLNFTVSILLSAFVAIAYTAIGGLWAVAFTDVIQLILLFLALFITIPFALEYTGGLQHTWDVYKQNKGMLANPFPPLDGWKESKMGNSYWQWWDYALLLAFGGIPWQVYFQRVLASKTAKVAKWLSIIAGFVCLLAAFPAVLIGMIGNVVDWSQHAPGPPENASLTLPYVIRYLTNPVVATIGLGGVAAAVMSSVDSAILSASSMASWNLYRPLIDPDVEAKELEKILKISIWIIGIAATLIALKVKSVYALWFLCSDFVYTILFPQLLLALYDQHANTIGAVSGLIVSFFLRMGGGVSIGNLTIPAFLPYPMIEDGTSQFPFRTFAMIGGLLTIIIVSRLTHHLSEPQPLTKTAQDSR